MELKYLKSHYGKFPYPEIYKRLSAHSASSIRCKANRLGLKADLAMSASIRRTGYRLHSVDCSYFAKLTPETCYWAGFIAADGNLFRQFSTVLKVSLNRKDRGHLQLLKSSLQFSGPIKDSVARCEGKEFLTSILCVRINESMTKDLKNKFNITERKSLTLNPPKLRKLKHIAPFIVGYIDGDGSIEYSERDHIFRLGIRGTFEVLSWFKLHFDNWIPSSRLSIVQTGKYPKYQLSGTRLLKISRILMDLSPYRLSRKWDAIVKTFD